MDCNEVTIEKYRALLNTYNGAIAESGHGNKKVKFRSRSEMREILSEMEFCLGLDTPDELKHSLSGPSKGY